MKLKHESIRKIAIGQGDDNTTSWTVHKEL